MVTSKTIALLALLASATVAQQYNGNYVENDYDYDQGVAPAPPARPAPTPARSYSRPAPTPLRSSFSSSANAPRPTPVPILKQINRHNEDGSYTYGYEGADGSFKIETKLTTGEVMGKYGYVDDLGKVRVVEYGANKFGFQPSGEGITVAPPTLVDETTRRSKTGEQLPEYDDGSYFEQPAPRPAPRARPAAPAPRPAPRPAPQPIARPAPVPQYSSYETTYEHELSFAPPAPRPAPAPRPSSGGGGSPVPPRAVIAGAAPVPASGHSSGDAVYSRPAAPPRAPAPVRPQPPVYHSQPLASFHPAPAPAPVHVPAAPTGRASRGGGSLLDQLARDYALPQGGSQPLTDISFSSFY